MKKYINKLFRLFNSQKGDVLDYVYSPIIKNKKSSIMGYPIHLHSLTSLPTTFNPHIGGTLDIRHCDIDFTNLVDDMNRYRKFMDS